ncbi:MAG: capsular biosynthesis protein [Lachnospiraceae bacterium]|nr:capsular biosynthesis protein [Lachnospiraceae bacterium]
MLGLYDIHCHLLPGVDDGAQSIEETRELLRLEYEDGVRTIIVTPHYRVEMFEPEMARIYQAFWDTCDEAEALAPDLKIYMGCEFHANMDMVETLKSGKRPTMAGSRFVLTEFREVTPFSYMRERVNALRVGGYYPIIAHAERYECLRAQFERAEELARMGARIQINAGSLLGDMGRQTCQYCRELIEEDLVWYVASDAHNPKNRRPNLGKCFAWLERRYGYSCAKSLLADNAEKLIQKGVRTN